MAEPRVSLNFSNKKIIIRQTSDRIRATVDYNGFLSLNNVHNLILKQNNDIDLLYVLGVLNSKLIDFVYNYLSPEIGRVFAEVKTVNLEK